jgi:hypothetical protein
METANFESLSLYIHVPFCAQKCNYCDFYSVPYNESAGNGYVDALLLEWKLIKEKYSLEKCVYRDPLFRRRYAVDSFTSAMGNDNSYIHATASFRPEF